MSVPTESAPLAPETAIPLIAAARDRDEVVGALCRAARHHGAFGVLFTLQGETLRGRLALGTRWIERASLPSLTLAASPPFRAVIELKVALATEVGADEPTRALLITLGRTSPMPAALVPIVMRDRVLAVLYLDAAGSPLPSATLGELGAVARAAGRQFERLLAVGRVGGGARPSDPPASPTASADVPRAPRVAMAIEVSLESEHNFYTGITGNISSGGLFVSTYTPPPRGGEVELDLLIEGRTHHVRGHVCWIRDARHATELSPAGCGLRFMDLSVETAAAIGQFVDQRDTIFFDDD